jgi:hypothetical protein
MIGTKMPGDEYGIIGMAKLVQSTGSGADWLRAGRNDHRSVEFSSEATPPVDWLQCDFQPNWCGGNSQQRRRSRCRQ